MSRITPSVGLLLAAVVIPAALLWAADPPAPPVTSSYAPAADLEAQVQVLLPQLETALADETTYTEGKDAIIRDAATLAVLAVALGLHDTDNAFRASAPALLGSSQELAAAADLAAAQAALVKVQAAVAGSETAGPELSWNKKLGRMGKLMAQVEFANTRLRRGVKRLDPKKTEENARYAAVMAVIAQGVLWDTHEVPDPAQFDAWYAHCAEMRDAAGQVNASIHAGDREAVDRAMLRLTKSCETCHAAFRPAE